MVKTCASPGAAPHRTAPAPPATETGRDSHFSFAGPVGSALLQESDGLSPFLRGWLAGGPGFGATAAPARWPREQSARPRGEDWPSPAPAPRSRVRSPSRAPRGAFSPLLLLTESRLGVGEATLKPGRADLELGVPQSHTRAWGVGGETQRPRAVEADLPTFAFSS